MVEPHLVVRGYLMTVKFWRNANKAADEGISAILSLDILGRANDTGSLAVAENQPVLNKNRMTQISTFQAFATQLRGFIEQHSTSRNSSGDRMAESEYNRLAVGLFDLQFEHNRPYRRFCEARNVLPGTVTGWREIPAMPTAGFKELELTCLAPAERTDVFYSSGTTKQTASRHFHNRESLAIYETSLGTWFRAHFTVEPSPAFLFLTPVGGLAPHSSLVHMFETLKQRYGAANSVFAGNVETDGAWNLDLLKAVRFLREAVAADRPVAVMGTAFNFVHLLDQMAEGELRFSLPRGSFVLETGGYKSRSRAMPKLELHEQITKRLGVAGDHIVSEYGMSELSSQAYDFRAGGAPDEARVFHFPPWARAQIIDPETGREAGEGETGLIRIFDLANVYSVMAIQTEDLGARRGDGFELLGRAALTEARGCSLMSA